MKLLLAVLWCTGLLIVPAAVVQAWEPANWDPTKAEPGTTYGTLPGFPLPKTIVFSVGPDEIIADAQQWRQHGVSAFFLDFVARDWSSYVWAADGEPWTIGASDKTFQKTKRATAVARRLGSEVFLKVAFDHPFEWFNDTAWKQIHNNFRQFGIFARDSGCHGLALDKEITIILSQSDDEQPLCGIYFNLHSPYRKDALPKTVQPLVERTPKPAE